MERPICEIEDCGNLVAYSSKRPSGGYYFRKKCNKHHELQYGMISSGKRKHWRIKKDHCETCNFKAEHSCQLDVDHIDGNHDNNEPSNLQTLCSNCHRLKTWKNKDYSKRKFVNQHDKRG